MSLYRIGPAAVLATAGCERGELAPPPGRPETGAGTPKPALWPPLVSSRHWVGCGGGLPPPQQREPEMDFPKLAPIPQTVRDPGGVRYGDAFISAVYPPVNSTA